MPGGNIPTDDIPTDNTRRDGENASRDDVDTADTAAGGRAAVAPGAGEHRWTPIPLSDLEGLDDALGALT